MCIREEPVLYLQRGSDWYSFAPRSAENLDENISTGKMQGDEITDLEVAIRKEVSCKYIMAFHFIV